MNYNNKIITITGGLGFVGSALANYLLENFSCKIYIIDNCLNSDKNQHLDLLNNDNVHFLEKDAREPKTFEKELLESNYIFHMACVQIAASSSNPELDLEVNATSTLRILQLLHAKRPVALERFLYTSSGSVYGASVRLPLRESDPTDPLSLYASTKMLGENYTLVYGKNFNVPVSAIRYSNVYGPGQTPMNPYCGVLGHFLYAAINAQPLKVIGDGEQTRDYTYVEDAVRATLMVANSNKTFDDVFNISTCTEVSVNQLVEIIKKEIPSTESVSIPERDIDNIRRRSLDIEKIHQKVGFSPQYNIHKGIKLTLEYIRKKNPK